ncbi:MAG: precorrin-3B C(17)-methyltransferase [Lachnospiraceae bacterium]
MSVKKLYVVGIGPGDEQFMTFAARKALEACELICGYTVYVELVQKFMPEKEVLSTPMMQEIERCRLSLEKANEGKTVAMVGSGDAGVYALAGPILEMSELYPEVEIEVVAGITAALSGGAVLGAPLTHDFATISLSDLMTPFDLIMKRVECAAIGDFCIAIYNPSSKKRSDYLRQACEILLQHRRKDTVCGIVRNIGRDREEKTILTLEALKDTKVDMFSTVFVGNSQTKVIKGKMVTPRGYDLTV